MNKVILVLGISALSGALGRLGGWIETKWRDIGVSACICATLGLICPNLGLWGWLSLIPTFGLQFACLTTYRYFLPKPKDYQWWHFSLHVFMISLAAVFFAWATGHWIGFGARCVINAILVGAISQILKWDILEEFSRYFIITLSTPLLLI